MCFKVKNFAKNYSLLLLLSKGIYSFSGGFAVQKSKQDIAKVSLFLVIILENPPKVSNLLKIGEFLCGNLFVYTEVQFVTKLSEQPSYFYFCSTLCTALKLTLVHHAPRL